MQRMMKTADPMIIYFTNDVVEVIVPVGTSVVLVVVVPVGTSVVLVVGDAVRYCVGCSL